MATTTTNTRVVTIAVLVLALLECSSGGVYGQSLAPAGAPGNDCLTALTNMSDCLTYVEAGSNLTKPDKGCCPELAGLVDNNPICLCNLLGNSDSIGIKIDLNKAINLPSVCGVTTPPVTTCSAISPERSATTPDAAGVPSGGLSPSEDKNGASGIEASAFTFIVVLLSTLSVSIFFSSFN